MLSGADSCTPICSTFDFDAHVVSSIEYNPLSLFITIC